jgi:hypothetical protein
MTRDPFPTSAGMKVELVANSIELINASSTYETYNESFCGDMELAAPALETGAGRDAISPNAASAQPSRAWAKLR